MKEIILFTDMTLFNECEMAARQNDLAKAQDFIIFSCEKFLTKNNCEKKLKKSIDLWLALDKMRRNQLPVITMCEFVEKICRDELHPAAPAPAKQGIIEKIGDALSLPRA